MDLKEIARNYFSAFSNKDLQSLKSFFSQSVTLRDWEIEANGLKDVIEANKKIFDSVVSIEVCPNNIYADGSVIIGEIEILINGEKRIDVVDIIVFDNDRKIKSIKAFKG